MKLKLILLFTIVPVLCYSQLSTNETPVSWSSQDVLLQRQTSDISQVVVSRLDLNKLQQEDLIDEQNGEHPRFGYLEKIAINSEDDNMDPYFLGDKRQGMDVESDCILYIENQTLTTSQTFTNACPVIMKNVTVSGGATIVVRAQEYILLESGVEVTSNSSLDLSLY